jgi:hypothetical protein
MSYLCVHCHCSKPDDTAFAFEARVVGAEGCFALLWVRFDHAGHDDDEYFMYKSDPDSPSLEHVRRPGNHHRCRCLSISPSPSMQDSLSAHNRTTSRSRAQHVGRRASRVHAGHCTKLSHHACACTVKQHHSNCPTLETRAICPSRRRNAYVGAKSVLLARLVYSPPGVSAVRQPSSSTMHTALSKSKATRQARRRSLRYCHDDPFPNITSKHVRDKQSPKSIPNLYLVLKRQNFIRPATLITDSVSARSGTRSQDPNPN